MRRLVIASVVWVWGSSAAVHAETCARAEFENVVDQASSTLVELTQKNTPRFQVKLRALKDKRGWSQPQFMKEGAPYVRDETIADFDARSTDLLARINGPSAGSADCKVLSELKAALSALVETQNAKWDYMFLKIDAALAQ